MRRVRFCSRRLPHHIPDRSVLATTIDKAGASVGRYKLTIPADWSHYNKDGKGAVKPYKLSPRREQCQRAKQPLQQQVLSSLLDNDSPGFTMEISPPIRFRIEWAGSQGMSHRFLAIGPF